MFARHRLSLGLIAAAFLPSGANAVAPSSSNPASTNLNNEPATVASSYVFTDLGTFSGGNSTAYAISESGHVVGTATISNTDTHAFEFWNGTLRDLGTLKGGVGSGALAVNDAGTIVGYGNVASTGAFHAVRFAASGPLDLNAAASANYSAAEGVNEAGQVVGFIEGANPNPNSSATIVLRAFVANNGAITLLPSLGGNTSEASSINNLSQIVGWSDLSGDLVEHAFLYAAGHSKDLGVLPGGTFSEALHINDSGQVVGVGNTTGGAFDAFLYSGGVLSDLGTLGGNTSVAYGINNSGDIVGYSYITPSNTTTDGFIYSNGAMTDLNDLTMTGAGGHTLDAALAINDGGQIVGEAIVGSVNSTTVHAFLLTPTAEATPPALSAGLSDALKLKGDTATFSATFTGSDPMSYQWYKNGTALTNQTNAALTLTNLQVSASGNYLVKASNLVGEMSSNMTLTVLIPPTFSKPPVNTNVLTGKPAKLTVTVIGSPPLSYLWQVSTDGGTTWTNITNGADTASGNTTATLNFSAASLDLSGDQFRCVVTNAGTSTASAPATLIVGGPPSISAAPVSITQVQGQDATFSVTATGDPAPTYQWYKGKTLLVGKTVSSLTITGAQAADADTYSVTVANPFKTLTDKATLKIIVPAGFSKQPVNVSVVAGKAAKFTVTATGTAKLTYQWEMSTDGTNWTAIPKATTNTYSIAKTTVLMNGQQFHCIVNNPAGTPATSNPATLSVGLGGAAL